MTIYQIVHKMNIDNAVPAFNVHHYEFDGYDPTTTEMQDFIDNLDSDYKTRLQSDLSDRVNAGTYDARRVDLPDLPALEYTATAGTWTGSQIANMLPPQNAAVVSWKAQTAFPRNTRSYISGLTEDINTDDGKLGTTIQTTLANWALDITFVPVVGQSAASKTCVEYTLDPPRVTTNNNVATSSVKPTWGSQNRRKYKN